MFCWENILWVAVASGDYNCMSATFNSSVTSKARQAILLLCAALRRLHLKYYIHFRCPQDKKDVKLLEQLIESWNGSGLKGHQRSTSSNLPIIGRLSCSRPHAAWI